MILDSYINPTILEWGVNVLAYVNPTGAGDFLCGRVSVVPALEGTLSSIPSLSGRVSSNPSLEGRITVNPC